MNTRDLLSAANSLQNDIDNAGLGDPRDKQLAKLRDENERLANGLRYLSVQLGLSSHLEIEGLARLAWDIAEEGKEAPEHVLSTEELYEGWAEEDDWHGCEPDCMP